MVARAIEIVFERVIVHQIGESIAEFEVIEQGRRRCRSAKSRDRFPSLYRGIEVIQNGSFALFNASKKFMIDFRSGDTAPFFGFEHVRQSDRARSLAG